ncbi:DoxX family protein [Nocardia zapadnayensis]|uniref:DoxX family protein n=1 Tax=Nocardia rhamnosiphila TaxID=426716 RepID=UPI0022475D6B|nr:DoxX family protein [Nocardia zapadnayensis]MCX0272820.1 DoxX family protein [Nocardia zapadnayensis]
MTALDTGALLLRLIAGVTMAAHGYQKFFSGGRIPGTARWFDSIGMRPGRLHAVLAAGAEVTTGLMLALGLLTPLAGAGFVGLMLVAAWTVHRANGFYSVNSGWEYNLVLAAIGVAVATTGPGEWSLDGLLGLTDQLSGLTGFAISAGGGLVAGAALLAICYRPAPAQADAQ